MSSSNLFEACKTGDVDRVRELIQGDSALVDAKEVGGIRPLHVAATEGHTEVVALLLDQGADVDAKNDYDVAPLYLAAAWGHGEVVSRLLAAGADKTVKGQNGETPLDVAARKSHKDVVALLEDGEAGAGTLTSPSVEAESGEQAGEIAALVAKLGDESDPVGRQQAQHALEGIGEPAVSQLIEQGLRDAGSSLRRWYAVLALGNIGNPAAVQPLRAALQDPDDDVKWEAKESLEKIGTPTTSSHRKRSWQFWRR